jgi:SAM-dependent methyltransferase
VSEGEALRLNIGCGEAAIAGFTGIDTKVPHWSTDPQRDKQLYNFIQHDVTEGIPFPDGVVDYIVAHHFIEHLSYPEGLLFLCECERVLKPGGVLTLVCPDFEHVARTYTENPDTLRDLGTRLLYPQEQGLMEWHKAAYDGALLSRQAAKVGLWPAVFPVEQIPHTDTRHKWQVAVRCTKPSDEVEVTE